MNKNIILTLYLVLSITTRNNLTTMRYIILFFCAIFFLSSCNSTRLTTIDVRKPAALTFPSDVANVVIVDNTPIETSSSKTSNNDVSIIKLDSAKAITLEHLNQFMNEEKYFNRVELYPYRTNGSTLDEVTPLSTRKIQAICNEKKANALISLDLFTVSGQLDTEDTGYMSSYRLMAAKLGALVRVYSAEGELYTNPIVLLDSLYREEATSWGKIDNNIPLLNELISELSVVAADHLTGKLIPSWEQQERWFYSSNSSDMKKAAKLAEANQWKEAAEIWISSYDKEENTNKKIRLASNLALAHEFLDDIDSAVQWINVAYDLLPNKSNSDLAFQVAAYKSFLEKRKNSIPELYKQLGIDETEIE